MRRRSHRTKPRPEMHSRIEHVKGPVYKGLGNYVTPNGSNALTSTVSRLFRAKSFKHSRIAHAVICDYSLRLSLCKLLMVPVIITACA